MTDLLYRVLKPGIVQRVAASEDEVRRPDVGDLINVSDLGAELLLREGYIERAHPTQLHGEEHVIPAGDAAETVAAAAAAITTARRKPKAPKEDA